jgi:glutaredoxin
MTARLLLVCAAISALLVCFAGPVVAAQTQTEPQIPSQIDVPLQVQTAPQTAAPTTPQPEPVPLSGPEVQTASQHAHPTIVFFYEKGCPDCEDMETLLADLLIGRKNVTVNYYEINAPGSMSLLGRLATHYGILPTHVPVIFVGDQVIIGAGRGQEFHLRTAVGDCATHSCPSPLDYAKQVAFPWQDVILLMGFAVLFVALLLLQKG